MARGKARRPRKPAKIEVRALAVNPLVQRGATAKVDPSPLVERYLRVGVLERV